MSWIDEQIRERKRKDNKDFSESLETLAATVTRKKTGATSDDRQKIKNALDEILYYYHVKPREIPKEMEEPEDQIEYVCRPHGMMRRNVILESGWYKDAAGAMLGTKTDGTTVALLPGKFGGYFFWDETSGKKIRLNKTTEKLLKKEAICFYKSFPQKKIGLFDLLKYILECIPKMDIMVLLLMMVAVTGVSMITPKITYLLFSEVVPGKSLRMFFSVLILSVCTTISLALLNGCKTLATNCISTHIEISVQAATMARILSLPASFFKDFSSGELASRSQYINTLCATFFSTILMSGITSLFSLTYISQIFIYAPSLVIPALYMTGITVVFTIFQSILQMRESQKQMEVAGKKDGMTYAILTGIQKIKLSGSEKRIFSRWVRLYTEEAKHTYGVPVILLLSGAISSAITLIGNIVMYFFAIKSGIGVADYYAFTAAYGMVSGAFLSTVSIALSFSRIKPVLNMAKPILEAVPENSEDRQMVKKLSGNIEINHLSFRYEENMPDVLSDLSVKISPGQYVAIVGKSGCGKSTLIRLLLGFEKPQKGAVYYDGKDINSLDLQSLRRNIGSVTQNGKLFRGDIFSNIVISAPWLTLKDAWEAAEIAGIDDDIHAMPMGMHTFISEGSGGISGGQKQRLMIARAVAPKPKILIFDEATSALDNITQKKVCESLDHLKCTRIVIAHRLSTIRQCDRIIVLDHGKIVEDGTYQELVDKKGFFAELVERQRLDIDKE